LFEFEVPFFIGESGRVDDLLGLHLII